MSAVKIPGIAMLLGGKDYVLAPLNAAAVKQYRDQIAAVFVGQSPDIELVAKLAHASLRRNYDDITLEEVEEWVDYGNLCDIWENVMNLSGLAVSAGKMMRRVQQAMEATGLTTQ